MDPNNLPPQPAVTPPIQPPTMPNPPAAGAPATPSVVQTSASGGGGKMKWIITIILIILILVAGWYFYMKLQGNNAPAPTSVAPAEAQPTVAPTNSPQTLNNDLNSVDVASDSSGFTPVDSDLNNL